MLKKRFQHNTLPFPVCQTGNEGENYLPGFKCAVTMNGVKYDPSPGFKQKMAGKISGTHAAVEDLLNQGSFLPLQFEVSFSSLE
jgi:hypothetical protein